jgi:hypothetical protein
MTATETQPIFGAAAAREMPTLACIGRVVGIDAPKETKGENEFGIKYHMYNIHLEGYGAGRKAKINFMIRPEWLIPGFNPATFESVEGGKGMEFMYGKHVSRRNDISTLQGLVGCNDEAFNVFCQALASAEGDPQGIYAVLQDILVEQGYGALVGYVLKQGREKGGFDEDGKQLYLPTAFYEINNFFNPNEKGRASQYKRAEGSTGGKFKVQFTEDDIPA